MKKVGIIAGAIFAALAVNAMTGGGYVKDEPDAKPFTKPPEAPKSEKVRRSKKEITNEQNSDG